METRFFFTYQLSQGMMTFFMVLNSGMTWRTMDAAPYFYANLHIFYSFTKFI